MGTLAGENVLITGAARGLGRSYALHMAGIGANVGINLKPYEDFEAETVMDEIRAMGVKSTGGGD